MAAADKAAIASGIASTALMEAAGAAVARSIQARFRRQHTLVLCGPGNNGGDGYVAARHLAAAGWPATVAEFSPPRAGSDAEHMATLWTGPTEAAEPAALARATLFVDALFGAGLARPLDGRAADLVASLVGRKIVAIDVPSGVAGDTGEVLGAAAAAALTVTFFRRKPGHLLYPGRALCGQTVVADIGIGENALGAIVPTAFRNGPALWAGLFPAPDVESNKYKRGQVLVVGGAAMTGAARLAARAAARVGAGLVTLASPTQAIPIYAADLAALVVRPMDDIGDFSALLEDRRRNCVLLGPGNGADAACRARVEAALAAGKKCVLDADALTVFADAPDALFSRLAPDAVLTPHDGEFKRLFPDLVGSRLARARAAAARANAVVLLKGADTVVAHPDGRASICDTAPPFLATAGAGDVLAGLVAGLVAQGMPSFEAASAAVYLHAACARTAGPGLVADDLAACLPRVLAELGAQTHLGTAKASDRFDFPQNPTPFEDSLLCATARGPTCRTSGAKRAAHREDEAWNIRFSKLPNPFWATSTSPAVRSRARSVPTMPATGARPKRSCPICPSRIGTRSSACCAPMWPIQLPA
jgi:NAD(P)H-hydrate epimerase